MYYRRSVRTSAYFNILVLTSKSYIKLVISVRELYKLFKTHFKISETKETIMKVLPMTTIRAQKAL